MLKNFMSSSKIVEIIWIGASQVVLLGVNFLLLKVMTSRLSVESFGVYSLCMTLVLFARQVIYDPISTVVVKNVGSGLKNCEAGNIDGFAVVRFVTDRLFLLLICVGVLVVLSCRFLLNISIDYLVVIACVVYLCSYGAQGIYLALLNIIKWRKNSALLAILDSVSKFAYIYLALRFIASDVELAIFALSVSTFSVFIVVRWYIREKFPPRYLAMENYRALIKHSLGVSFPLYLPIFLGALKGVFDRWVLAAYVGVEELAAFTVLLQIGYFPLILIFGVVQTFVAPQVYVLAGDRSGMGGVELRAFLEKIMFGITVMAVLLCGISFVFSDFIFHLVVGEAYKFLSTYLSVFIVCGAVASAGGVLHLAATGVFETKVLGRLLGVTVGINCILTFVLIIEWGFVGAVVALLLGGGLSVVLYWIVLLRSDFCRQ